MATKNEPQCGFCGGTDFFFEPVEGSPSWMGICCDTCELWMYLSKANARLSTYEEPNRSTAIDRYVAHTERLAMQMLKNDAAKEVVK